MIFGFPKYYADPQDVTATEYLFSSIGRGVEFGKDLDGIGLFVLYGGEDISTSWYHQRPIKADAGREPRARELTECGLVDACIKRKIPVLGICRGAQFLCCLLGGKVWQHVDGHEGKDHQIWYDGKKYMSNSYHHQMMIPTPDMEMLAFADNRSPVKWSEELVEDWEEEPEILFHPGFRVLMIQGHPEWVEPSHDLFNLTRTLVKEKLQCHI